MFQVAVAKLATTVADADEPAATVAEVEVAAEEVVPRAPALRCQSTSTSCAVGARRNAHSSVCSLRALTTSLPAARRLVYQVAVDVCDDANIEIPPVPTVRFPHPPPLFVLFASFAE